MSRYRRPKIEGGAFFYTLALADRGGGFWFVTSNARGTLFRQAITR